MWEAGESVTVGAPLVVGATVFAEISDLCAVPSMIHAQKAQAPGHIAVHRPQQHLTTGTITSDQCCGTKPAKRQAPEAAARKLEAARPGRNRYLSQAPKARQAADAATADNLKKKDDRCRPALSKRS